MVATRRSQGCPARRTDLPCTREPGHPGKHMAEGFGTGIVAMWVNDDDPLTEAEIARQAWAETVQKGSSTGSPAGQ